MHKTTVYLNDEEIESLRQLAAATGRSQADLIREAIRRMASPAPPRRFRSLGKGESATDPVRSWNPVIVYAELFTASNSNSAPTADPNRA
jgi:hypothetical protein